ncbi:dihydrofolate reductase family protein [Pleomorphovibrio marinus]|nr:dihydrofolate reductase family protein [Pleomorphovibrio marinus]
MRKIIYVQMVSLDGYLEGPKGELGWSAPGEELHQHFNDL